MLLLSLTSAPKEHSAASRTPCDGDDYWTRFGGMAARGMNPPNAR